MSKNLRDALKAAKKDRNVLSKHIIWESGVGKTQFYRIINGEEAPSPDTKNKMAKALGINIEQFEELQNNSKQAEQNLGISRQRKNKWLIPLSLLSVFLIGSTALIVNNKTQSAAPNISKNIASEEDSTLFIKDVTIPDGTAIPINTEFVKTWRVKNTGKVVWKNRYLKRMTPPSSLVCASPTMVTIPETAPGETVDISVTFKTPYLPGSCRTDWKTADKDGNLYFPDMHGLFVIVTVVAD